MATKAELEAELAQLQVELKELRYSTRDDSAAAKGTATETPPLTTLPPKTRCRHLHALKDGDLEGIAHQLDRGTRRLPHRKPLLLALGALTVGYLIGRSGRKG